MAINLPKPGVRRFKPTGVTGKKMTASTLTPAQKKKLALDMERKKMAQAKPIAKKAVAKKVAKKAVKKEVYKSAAMKRMHEKMEPAKMKAMEKKMGMYS